MPYHSNPLDDLFLTRRDFLARCGMGFGAIALGGVLGDSGAPTAQASGGHSMRSGRGHPIFQPRQSGSSTFS